MFLCDHASTPNQRQVVCNDNRSHKQHTHHVHAEVGMVSESDLAACGVATSRAEGFHRRRSTTASNSAAAELVDPGFVEGVGMCRALRAGDKVIVRLVLNDSCDFSRSGSGGGVLLISVNNRNVGQSFVNLPRDVNASGGKGYTPVFGLFDTNDRLTVVRGSMPITAETTDMLRRANTATRLRVESEEEEDSRADHPQVRQLLQMGYPLESCLKALERGNGRVAIAAEYLLRHADELSAQLRDKKEKQMAQRKEIAQRQTGSWYLSVLMDARFKRMQRAWAERVKREGAEHLSDSDEDSDEESSDARSRSLSVASDADESIHWGVRVIAVPHLGVRGIREAVKKNPERLRQLRREANVWSLAADEELISLVNRHCASASSLNSLELLPQQLQPTARQMMRYPHLVRLWDEGKAVAVLQTRFLLLRNFNLRLRAVLPFLDLSCVEPARGSHIDRAFTSGSLAGKVTMLRGVILYQLKSEFLHTVLARTALPKKQRPTVRVNRMMAMHSIDAMLGPEAPEDAADSAVDDADVSGDGPNTDPRRGRHLRSASLLSINSPSSPRLRENFLDAREDFPGTEDGALATANTMFEQLFRQLHTKPPSGLRNSGELRRGHSLVGRLL